jgi:molybdopterin-guanine dinucleotide biosynthesis protein A
MRTHSPADVTIAVLVGGQSTRMGRDKAGICHPLSGTYVEHVVSVAQRVASEVVLLGPSVSRPHALRYLPIWPDSVPGAGPLAGLCSALTRSRARWVLLLSCDLPLLDEGVLSRLLAARTETVDAIAFQCHSCPPAHHTCCTLYHQRLLPVVHRELLRGKRSLQAVLRCARLVSLPPNEREAQQLTNVNTREELARVQAEFEAQTVCRRTAPD